MKKLWNLVWLGIIAGIALLIIVSIVKADTLLANKVWVERECSICAKTIWEQQDYTISSPYYFDNMSYNILGTPWPVKEEVEYLNMPDKITVCKDCKRKYQQDLSTTLFVTLDSWVNSKKKENEKLRVENIERRKITKIEEIKDKVNKLNKELDAIKGGTK